MPDAVELAIKISGADHKLTKEILYYSEPGKELYISSDCVPLQRMVEKAVKEFPGNVEDIVLKFKYAWLKDEASGTGHNPDYSD